MVFVLVVGVMIGLTGCGGGGGGSSTPPSSDTQTGYLIDSAVDGVEYITSSGKSGTTSDGGKFEYANGDTNISFSIGGLKFPDFNLSNLNSDSKILPTDLVGVDRNNTTDGNVTKILQILQTLDEDSNATNGITITLAVRNAFGVNKNILDSNISDVNSTLHSAGITNRTIITLLQARAHFEKTLRDSFGYDINTTASSNIFQSGQTWKGLVYNTVESNNTYTSEITANGKTYPAGTKRVWLDRNLGATMVCTESRDSGNFADNAAYVTSQQNCFGDYYQWGRNTDGHEKTSNTTYDSKISDLTSSTNFITGSSDWTSIDSDGSTRSANWSKTDGTSVCPVGYRVPTIAELRAETVDLSGFDNRSDAFESFLKLPSAGRRHYYSGSVGFQGSFGDVWSSSPSSSDATDVFFSSLSADWYGGGRAPGRSVRCIKD
jgi:hypothetical protein